MSLTEMPFAIASTVVYKEREYYIEKIGHYGDDYAIIGHEALHSKGFGIAWISHDFLKLSQEPTLESWNNMLEACREEDGDDGEDEEEDDV